MGEVAPWSRLRPGDDWGTDEEHPETKARREVAYSMRLGGSSYPEIGEAFGVTGSEAYAWCEKTARERGRDTVEMARQLEADRLDRYLLSLHKRYLEAPDTKVMELLLRVMDRRARLFGLDAPTKVDANLTTRDPMDVALEEVLREAREAEATAEARARGAGTD